MAFFFFFFDHTFLHFPLPPLSTSSHFPLPFHPFFLGGKHIPTELRTEAASLKKEIEYDDEETGALKSHIDDEYAKAGIHDPKILLTTAREPSSRLKQFAREMKLVFPNSQRINRGNTIVKELVEVARDNEFTDIVVLHEHRGEPGKFVCVHLLGVSLVY